MSPFPYTQGEVMMAELTGFSITELSWALNQADNALSEGETMALQLCTEQLPDSQTLNAFYNTLLTEGFHVSKPVGEIIDGVATTSFTMRKGSPLFALLVPLIPVVIIGGLIAFGIFNIQSITKALLPIILVVVGGVVLISVALAKPAEAAATTYLGRRNPALLSR